MIKNTISGDRDCTFSIAGINSMERKTACEDIIRIDELSGIRLYGLADGQSGKKRCKIGGETALNEVFKFIVKKGITQLLRYEHIDELQYEIIKAVREAIVRLSDAEGEDKKEYSSTLVVFAYEINTGRYISIHLGDGFIIGNTIGNEICMVSPPDNGLTPKYTWLTTSSDALYHLRVGFGNIDNYKRILLATDGASIIARGKNISERAKKIIKSEKQKEIIDLIVQSNPQDDASCIVIDINELDR